MFRVEAKTNNKQEIKKARIVESLLNSNVMLLGIMKTIKIIIGIEYMLYGRVRIQAKRKCDKILKEYRDYMDCRSRMN